MVAGRKKQDKYHSIQCPGPCKRFFHSLNGLSKHKAVSRCGRMQKGKLDQKDKEMIAKGWEP